jgi:RNA polymerase sigma factor (sigma-70 family)
MVTGLSRLYCLMPELSQAEQYLIDQVRRGETLAWSALVERFQGRLLAFARRRAPADAEDLVQETFLHFMNGLASFRGEASLETWLFMILRRRIIDCLRGKRLATCDIQDQSGGESDSGTSALQPAAPDLTASAYARRDEQLDRERSALAEAMLSLVEHLRQERDFRSLKIVELLFYGQLRNNDIAQRVGMEEKQVGLIKFRWLKQLRQAVAERLEGADVSAIEEPGCADSLLTEIWEENRPSCPKRSTVGGYLLHTLDTQWQDYVEFHLVQLGCRFCQANLDDLKSQQEEAPRVLRERIMQSTVGFFRR